MPAQNIKLHPIQINLLPNASDFEKTSWGRFIFWALSIGRYIVVFTELVVIIAFLSRFKLDKDLTDLHDAIENKKAIVASASNPSETEFRQLQKRIATIETIEKQQGKLDVILAELPTLIPIDVSLTSFTLNHSTLSFDGVALSEAGLATLIYKFKSSNHYSEISINTINKTIGSPQIQFSLTANATPEML